MFPLIRRLTDSWPEVPRARTTIVLLPPPELLLLLDDELLLEELLLLELELLVLPDTVPKSMEPLQCIISLSFSHFKGAN